MPLRELLTKDPEQLTFKAFELAEVVREIDGIETQKKEANEEWTAQIKALERRVVKLAYEVQQPI